MACGLTAASGVLLHAAQARMQVLAAGSALPGTAPDLPAELLGQGCLFGRHTSTVQRMGGWLACDCCQQGMDG